MLYLITKMLKSVIKKIWLFLEIIAADTIKNKTYTSILVSGKILSSLWYFWNFNWLHTTFPLAHVSVAWPLIHMKPS